MADKILRVDMSSLSVRAEPVPAAWARYGGRALTSTIVAAEVPPTCDALGPRNKLVFAPGVLTGTPAASSGRLSAGAKSPLTGTIKESNAGGTSGQALARMGIKALIVEGVPKEDRWYGLHLTRDGASIQEEKDLVGSGNFDALDALERRLGRSAGAILVGPAGEMRMNLANLSVKDPSGKIRSHGRGGLGAVMGSKRLKLVTLDAAHTPPVNLADPEKFASAAKTFANALTTHPVSGRSLPTYGTAILVNVLNEVGGLPVRNFRYGQLGTGAAHAISGETVRATLIARGGKTRRGCSAGCVIQCSQVFTDSQGKYVSSGFEYPTISGLGANCCIADLDDIAALDHLMDDIGCDAIETPVALAVAMEAGVLPFGDGKQAIQLLDRDIRKGTPLGRILGGGAGLVGKIYGLTRVPVVKNQGIPAYDPRAVKGVGITYATSTMGADHTSGYAVATNILNIGGHLDPLEKHGQVELSRRMQIASAAVDSTGLCLFIAFPALDIPECLPAVADMISARFGISMGIEDVAGLGKYVLKTERDFNMRAGFTKEHDRLPEFFADEPLPPHGTVWDFTPQEIDAFWDF